ncbi:hypothetical protein BC939DRAFT_33520 [Gamsiella multidivaricata]|uniref:uncharacterized protein n=1 Tax=Gamsiella multidivaricata TaxID=101098 RepID=UPI002220286F|nr:uncharacterized protein BC939DRAFT_33520 [Gamsiella multidivaricata]KAI7816685.1 hypothetical protein BC939DRAFT_33520 [Gamsiella multidivaricata]
MALIRGVERQEQGHACTRSAAKAVYYNQGGALRMGNRIGFGQSSSSPLGIHAHVSIVYISHFSPMNSQPAATREGLLLYCRQQTSICCTCTCKQAKFPGHVCVQGFHALCLLYMFIHSISIGCLGAVSSWLFLDRSLFFPSPSFDKSRLEGSRFPSSLPRTG